MSQCPISSGLCKYKEIFGKPGEGVHKYRLFDIAIIDLLFTVVFAFIVSYYFKWSFWKCLLVIIIIGIVFHRLFCVRTTFDKILFD